MPSPFDITAASNTVTLDNNRSGIASFTAKNNARRRIQATAKLVVSLADDKQPITTVPSDASKWLTIAPPPPGSTDTAASRDFAVDGTQSYQINILVPPTAPPASYKVKLTLADEANPDDNFSDSPDVVFSVREVPKPQPRPFPIWIIAAIVIVVLLIIVIAVVAISSSGGANSNATATVAAAAIETANAETAVAAEKTQEATQAALAANMTATQAAVFQLQTSAASSGISNQTLAAALSMTAAQNDLETQQAEASKQAAIVAQETSAAAVLTANAIASEEAAATEELTAVAQKTAVANMTATQTVINLFYGFWATNDTDSLIKILLIVPVPDDHSKVNITFTSLCSVTTGDCGTTATSNLLNNVVVHPQFLMGGIGNTTLRITPSNNNQITVSYNVAGHKATVTFHQAPFSITVYTPTPPHQ